MRNIVLFSLVVGSLGSFSAVNLSIVDGADVMAKTPVHQTAEGKKGIVVVFLSAKCPCSDSHVVEIKSLHKDYPEFSFVVVNSNTDETDELAQQYFKRVGFEFPVIKDKSLELADRYKAFKTPHAFVMNKDGKVLYQGGVSSSRQFATADRKYLREALANIHDDKSVAMEEGRTLGCVITRGEKNVW
jgi:thioredoxin-related protein